MTLSIELSEELRIKAQARAKEAGYANLSDYLASLLEEDIQSSELASQLPQRVSMKTREELESKLQKGTESPSREVTPEQWEAEQVQRLMSRHAKKQAG